MKLPLLILTLACVLLTPRPAPAQGAPMDPLPEEEAYETAIQAMADAMPGVAAEALKRLYRQRGPDMPEEARALLASKLLESLARSGKTDELLTFVTDPFIAALPGTPFWTGTAHAMRGEVTDALDAFQIAAADRQLPLSGYAMLSAANLQADQGDRDAALQSLAPLLTDPEDPLYLHARLKAVELLLDSGRGEEARRNLTSLGEVPPELRNSLQFLEAKAARATGRLDDARTLASALIETTRQVDPRIHDRARILLADIDLQARNPDAASDTLLRFVNERKNSPVLHQAFSRLDHLGFFQRDQPIFDTWLRADEEELHALTRFFSSGVEDRDDLARRSLEAFLRFHPQHRLVPLAQLRLAALLLDPEPARAVDLLTSLREHLSDPSLDKLASDLLGRAQFKLGAFDAASEAFQDSATRFRERNSVFNSAVAALYADQEQQYLAELQQLNLEAENQELADTLRLERALFLASHAHHRALSALKECLVQDPSHPRAAEAELAIAELHLLEFPPKPVSARKQLETLRRRRLDPELEMQADYVSVWIAAAAGDLAATMDEGSAFLRKWPRAPLRGEIRMKLGEIHFANRNYPNAQTQFETLVEEEPDSAYAETALFFAAKAAQASMSATGLQQAIVLWGRVVDRAGPLAEEARRQQGLAKLKQGQPDDALLVFNQVLANDDRLDPDLRLATLVDKGQAYYLKAGQSDVRTQLLIAAIGAYDEVRETPYASRFWKNQASVYKARCLEELQDYEQALQIYYEVVNRPPAFGLGPGEIPDFTWYYRAGFGALALLRGREDWHAAVRLAEKLAATSGNRAEDAARVVGELRLKHFIWEDFSPQ